MNCPVDFLNNISLKDVQMVLFVILVLAIIFKPSLVKPYQTQIILFLIILCMISSDTVEGNDHDSDGQSADDGDVKSFYAFFGRESAEGKGVEETPPYYVPENIDFADLKGELAFFKNEFLPDSQPYSNNSEPFKEGRKYGISFIDKWVFKYKGDFGSFASFQDQAVGPCVNDATPPSPVYPCPTDNPLVTQLMSDYNDGKYLGIQPAMGGGYYISSIGECPNLNSEDKSSDACLQYSNKIKVVDIDKFKTTQPDDDKPIVASYVGSVSLNDIVNHGQPSVCKENVVNAYENSTKIHYPSQGPDKDSDSPIFSNFLNNAKVEDSDIFKLLSNSDIFNCKMESPGKYSIATPTDLGNIGTIDSKKNTPSTIAVCTPGDGSQCPKNYYHCSDNGGCQTTPWEDCNGKQCKEGVSLFVNY